MVNLQEYLVQASLPTVATECYKPLTDTCNPDYLNHGLNIKDGKVLQFNATWVTEAAVSGAAGSIDYCDVIVTYTHPKFNDTIHTQVVLPSASHWNGRFQGVGGGGWAGNSGIGSLMKPLGQNYSAGMTDAGHDPRLPDSSSWWLDSHGQINIDLFTDFASVALGDLADIGKQLSNRYYGYGPVYSYWNGCSTGGRQGWMMAQRYPEAYDGIYAGAPAAQWDRFVVAGYWSILQMNIRQHYPNQCIFNAFTAAVVEACDGLDGVTDGVIDNFAACKFDPKSMVGTQVDCSGTELTIVEADAEIVAATWQGPRTQNGDFVWWGILPGTPFSGLSNTICTNVTDCKPVPFSIPPDWISRWCLGDAGANLTALTVDEFIDVFHKCKAKYEHIIGTNDVDLTPFARAGGKMISWHGLSDELIFPLATGDYYQRVLNGDPNAKDYFRFFYAPGAEHCGGGAGYAPLNPFQAVVDWTEKGIVPETLAASGPSGNRDLCLYPLVAVYKGGDTRDAGSYDCQEGFSAE